MQITILSYVSNNLLEPITIVSECNPGSLLFCSEPINCSHNTNPLRILNKPMLALFFFSLSSVYRPECCISPGVNAPEQQANEKEKKANVAN